MINPTLERAARAVSEVMASAPAKAMNNAEWIDFERQIARAVLMAVRDPSEAMVKAAEDREEEIVGTYGCADPTGGFETDGPKICFTAMIDAILAEGE